MKNFLLGVLTSVVLLCTVAATVPNSLMTIKPAKPIAIVCLYEKAAVLQAKIFYYESKGYVTTQLSYGGYGGYGMAVLHKYKD